MNYTKRRKIMKVILLFGFVILIFQGMIYPSLKTTRIKKLKEEAEEEIRKEEFEEAIKLYEQIEVKTKEEERELEALKIYVESKKLFEQEELELAEFKIDAVNEAMISKVLREKIDLLQEEIDSKSTFNIKIIEVEELRKEKDYIKAINEVEELQKERLDKERIEEVKRLEIKLEKEYLKYRVDLKEQFTKDVINLENTKVSYEVWDMKMKEILNELQKVLDEEKRINLREDHGRWKIQLEKLTKDKKEESIKTYVKGLIQKF
ncbi:MAG: hypothetical protein ACRC30_16065 [Clostridium sp.]